MSSLPNHYTLVISCPDQVGLVAAVSSFIAERGGCLVESSNHTDLQQGWFYMRNVINVEDMQQDIASLVGSSREMVSRIFKDLKEGGYISVEGKRICINKKLPPNW